MSESNYRCLVSEPLLPLLADFVARVFVSSGTEDVYPLPRMCRHSLPAGMLSLLCAASLIFYLTYMLSANLLVCPLEMPGFVLEMERWLSW